MSDFVATSERAEYQIALAPQSGTEYWRTLRDQVDRALGDGERHVVIDCREWRRLDLRVLSALLRCARSCGEYGAGFELINLEATLVADLHELRLDGRVDIRS